MELLKLLLGVSLIFIAAKAVTGKMSQAEVNCRKDMQSLKLLGYNIDLIPYINEDGYKKTNIYTQFKSYIDKQRAKGNFVFYGESTVIFQFIDRLNKLCLHALNLDLYDAATKIVFTLDGKNNVSHTPRFYIYDNESQIVNLYLENLRLSDSYTYRLVMKYVGSISDNIGAFIKTSYINDKGDKTWLIAAGDFLGAGARQIFPCWDEPDLRTNFTISVKHHRNYRAISNMPIDMESTDDDGMLWTRFKTTDSISPYHIAIVLSKLDHIPNTNVWCRRHVEQKIEFAREVAINAISYLYDLKILLNDTKIPPKVDHVIIPSFRDEGLESWGLVFYRETAVMYDEKLDFVAWKFEVARMVARKIVHQFFGNLIGQSWWSYLWLNEGIASFLAMEIVNKYVHSHLSDLLTVQFQHESFRLNDYYDMPLIAEVITPSDLNSLFSFTYYVKAPVFIRIIRILTEGGSIHSFHTGLNKYLTAYQRRSIDTSNNTIDTFFDILQKTLIPLDESIFIIKRLSEWVQQERYSVLQVTRKFLRDVIEIRLSQKFVNKTSEKNLWILVTYTTQSIPNVVEERWLSPHEPIIHLTNINKNDCIIVNVRQAGYYRVNYDVNNWEKLIKYLNSAEYYYIDILNRAQIIDDSYYFLLNNKLDFRIFKNLTYYLSNERDYVAWYPMFKIMEDISGFFPFPESMEVKEHFREILNSVLPKIGFSLSNFTFIVEESKGNAFIKCLRQEVAKWACILNCWNCMFSASLKLKHRRIQPILPGWKEWTYCKGLMLADDISWLEVYNTEKLNNNILESLACTKDHTVIFRYINLLKLRRFTEARDRITIFHSIIARHVKNNLVLDYIINNFANVVPREIKTIVALTDIINHLYIKDQIIKIRIHFGNRAPDIFSGKINQYVYDKTEQRLDEINKHNDYFKSFLMTKRIMV